MDPKQPKPSLSEISHLFLSSVRQKQTGGVPRSQRTGPKLRKDVSVDLTPEEFAEVFGEGPRQNKPDVSPFTAIIGAHLNGTQLDRGRQYARHLAADGKRIGLIELDASEFRLMRFECGVQDHVEPQGLADEKSTETYEPRQMIEALEEMAWDVDHWLLLLPNPRLPEARTLLRQINHWVLLSTCDHDGVVSAYRTIKGLAESQRPRLTLSLLDGSDPAEIGRVCRKLSNVCQQFLHWPMEAEAPVTAAPAVAEHLVISSRPTRDKAQMAAAPQWQIVTDFVERASKAHTSSSHTAAEPQMDIHAPALSPDEASQVLEDLIVSPVGEPAAAEVHSLQMPMPEVLKQITPGAMDEVADLPSGELTEAAVLDAVINRLSGELVQCPLHPPMCPQAKLAVNREHRLVMLAVARQGLLDLRAIAQAYRWLIENRPLIGMALPQLAIDAHSLPSLRLLVDRADLSADLLQPMLQTGSVTVQSYRKLRWGQKTGLLLEAA